MIYYFTPAIIGNLGAAYNHYCNLVPNADDWITLIDGDVMQLHLDWVQKWENILHACDDAGIVTCLTNRIGTPQQRHPNVEQLDSILQHRRVAEHLFNQHKYTTVETSQPVSGFFFAFKKRTWQQVGGFVDGVLHVDYTFSRAVLQRGLKIYVAAGYYVLHYYRFLEAADGKYTAHLTAH